MNLNLFFVNITSFTLLIKLIMNLFFITIFIYLINYEFIIPNSFFIHFTILMKLINEFILIYFFINITNVTICYINKKINL